MSSRKGKGGNIFGRYDENVLRLVSDIIRE